MKSILFVRGNDPKMLLDSTLYSANAIAYDLHEAVDADNKDAARLLIEEAIKSFDFGAATVLVRVNPMCQCGTDDIAAVGKSKPHALIIPNARVLALQKADAALNAVEKAAGLEPGVIKIIPQISTVVGVESIKEILAASTRITAVLFSAAGMLKDLGVEATGNSDQLLYARSEIALACRVANVPAIDTPYANFKDLAGLEEDAKKAKSLGFAGKAAISGNQVSAINRIFA